MWRKEAIQAQKREEKTMKLPTKCVRKVVGISIYSRIPCGKPVMKNCVVCAEHSANPDDWPSSKRKARGKHGNK
jgi:hypothetical protein